MSIGKSEEDFNINLAKLVEKYPCLYDYTRKDYNNIAFRAAAWQTISESLSGSDVGPVTVDDCKLRWKSLRGCITRDKKFARQGNKTKKPYYLKEHLEFIKPFTRLATRTSRASVRLINYNSDLDESLTDQDTQGVVANDSVHVSIKPEALQRQAVHHQIQQRLLDSPSTSQPMLQRDEDNQDMTFFKSLMPDVSRMNPRQRSTFRLGVVSLIDQVLYSTPDNSFNSEQHGSPGPNTTCSTVVNWNS